MGRVTTGSVVLQIADHRRKALRPRGDRSREGRDRAEDGIRLCGIALQGADASDALFRGSAPVIADAVAHEGVLHAELPRLLGRLPNEVAEILLPRRVVSRRRTDRKHPASVLSLPPEEGPREFLLVRPRAEEA